MLEQRFELAALGDVADVGDVPGDRRPVAQVGEHGLHVADVAVGVPDAELGRPHDLAQLQAAAELGAHVAVVGHDELGRQSADELRGGQSDERLARGAGVGDDAVVVDDKRGVARVLDERPEAVLAGERRRFGALLLRAATSIMRIATSSTSTLTAPNSSAWRTVRYDGAQPPTTSTCPTSTPVTLQNVVSRRASDPARPVRSSARRAKAPTSSGPHPVR